MHTDVSFISSLEVGFWIIPSALLHLLKQVSYDYEASHGSFDGKLDVHFFSFFPFSCPYPSSRFPFIPARLAAFVYNTYRFLSPYSLSLPRFAVRREEGFGGDFAT